MVSRSRKGAWIEITELDAKRYFGACRSRKGAWIEIFASSAESSSPSVAPARERGLK